MFGPGTGPPGTARPGTTCGTATGRGGTPGRCSTASGTRPNTATPVVGGENPLVRFLRAEATAGGPARSLTVPAPPGRENIVVHQPAELRPSGSVAVMVHAYYADTFDQICGSLQQALRFPFTLLVSTPTDETRVDVDASIRRHGLPSSAVVRVVPNRGRNFGPFVAAFAPEIAAHDYVLHLHTKRSLFTGSDQAHWRDQLVSSLVGSPAVAGAALQLLAGEAGGPGTADEAGAPSRPPIGLVFPTTATTMPHWAHHWLSNAAAAPGLFARLSVGRFPTGGYFEYPVGGMFWARVDAIRPLLDAGLTFDDFPVESRQTDGTLAHVIERCFVPLVQSRGYDFVELDRETGACQLGWGTSNLDQYRALSASGLREAIEGADIVSFDIFDTVVTRRSTRPDSVIRLAGERLRRLHPAAADFFTVRKQAEDRARASRQWTGDVSLPEIYDAFPHSAPWDAERRSQALAIEIDDDLATSVVRAAVADAVRHAHSLGKRVIGISDTYFERPHVERAPRPGRRRRLLRRALPLVRAPGSQGPRRPLEPGARNRGRRPRPLAPRRRQRTVRHPGRGRPRHPDLPLHEPDDAARAAGSPVRHRGRRRALGDRSPARSRDGHAGQRPVPRRRGRSIRSSSPVPTTSATRRSVRSSWPSSSGWPSIRRWPTSTISTSSPVRATCSGSCGSAYGPRDVPTSRRRPTC